MTMTLDTPIENTQTLAPQSAARWRRWTRPALGLLLPLTAAVAWEWMVAAGWSDGRLVPPPSTVISTIDDLARSGELFRHMATTLERVGAGFALGVAAGTVLGAVSGSWRGGCSIRPSRRSVPFPRSPGCRCSSCGSASLSYPRSR